MYRVVVVVVAIVVKNPSGRRQMLGRDEEY